MFIFYESYVDPALFRKVNSIPYQVDALISMYLGLGQNINWLSIFLSTSKKSKFNAGMNAHGFVYCVEMEDSYCGRTNGANGKTC